MHGVSTKIIVWRHALHRYINRFLYLGEVSIDSAASNLEKRCQMLGLSIEIFNVAKLEENDSEQANKSTANIIVVIVGSPVGLYLASHHEKLLLIDAECSEHAVAFVGGFDIAKGRFDQPNHLV